MHVSCRVQQDPVGKEIIFIFFILLSAIVGGSLYRYV